jgi:hypothetical protein
MSDLELLADTMEEWSSTSGDHHMLAAAAIRQLIKLQAALQHSGEAVADKYEKLEPALEALVELCNNLNMGTYDEVIAAEAALERLYLAREKHCS